MTKKPRPIFFDTETCGLHGMPVLLQFAIGDGEIELYEIWKSPILQTLELIKFMMEHPDGVVGFNLAFDMFHLNKLYNVFKLYADNTPGGYSHYPEEHVKDIVKFEKAARDGVCLKPVKACDLFLWARKNKWQALMERSDIRIRRVPIQLAQSVADELKTRVPINPLFFKRRKNQLDNPWQVFDIEDKFTGEIDRNFKDIVLKFSPSTALKGLAIECLNIDKNKVLTFKEVELPSASMPLELGYAPFADALTGDDRYQTWDWKIKAHIDHWSYNTQARQYAADDITYTRGLYYHEDFGAPELGDVDSELACSVAAIRWKGFAINIERLKRLREAAIEKTKRIPTAPSRVKKLIHPLLSPEELAATGGSTAKVVLEKIATFMDDCDKCNGDGSKCSKCKGKGGVYTESAKAAQAVLSARKALKEIELFDKLILAGRFHASFKVIGALSGRMAGADQLNPQGIKATKDVRSCFPMKFDDEHFCGGDAESFEVVIAAAVYNDERLYADLQTLSICPDCKGKGKVLIKQTNAMTDCGECKGTGQSKKKIHGIFATALYPDEDYESVVMSKGTEHDMYKDGKQGVFSQLYGGNKDTLMRRLGITEDNAVAASDRWVEMYPNIGKAQRRIFDMFCSMRQPKAGGKVYWHDPAEFMPTLLGFKRFFTLENAISKALFDLADDPPKSWLNLKITVQRRDKLQLVAGAVRSALFGAAFQVQAGAMRAATNHEIQGTGAGITKEAQAEVWKIQPSGIHEWVVRPMNIHDEILTVCKSKEVGKLAEQAVRRIFDKHKPIVPLLSIAWNDNMETWADKT